MSHFFSISIFLAFLPFIHPGRHISSLIFPLYCDKTLKFQLPALNTVLITYLGSYFIGNLKREHPDMNEELICLRAIRDVNVPKFLLDDLKLFRGIVSDLFPKIKEEDIDYGALMDSIRSACPKLGCKDVDGMFKFYCFAIFE